MGLLRTFGGWVARAVAHTHPGWLLLLSEAELPAPPPGDPHPQSSTADATHILWEHFQALNSYPVPGMWLFLSKYSFLSPKPTKQSKHNEEQNHLGKKNIFNLGILSWKG